jgi:hypothetical protein
MRIVLQIDDQLAQQLTVIAHRLGIRPEELAGTALQDLLAQAEDAFQAASDQVVNKNRELYRRLSA